MNSTDLVSLRMHPWRAPVPETGHYLRHDGQRARTAYFVVTVKQLEEAWLFKCQRLPVCEIPADATVHLFHWNKRERKSARKLRAG